MAALDLGSNSFHLLIAEFKGDRLRVIDRLKDMVRLAEGLGESGRLKDDIADRALKSLERIGQRLRGLPGKTFASSGLTRCAAFATAAPFYALPRPPWASP